MFGALSGRRGKAGSPQWTRISLAVASFRGFAARCSAPSRGRGICIRLGALFGLGFDTATEIGVLSISAVQSAQGLSLSTVLVFPALFTAGMALVDTTDSVLMAEAYGWAFVHPVRKLWYNLTITAASVAMALFIGGIEAAGLIADKFALTGPVWRTAASLNADLANFGFVVIGVFVLSWVISAAIYRWKGYGDLPVAVEPVPVRN